MSYQQNRPEFKMPNINIGKYLVFAVIFFVLFSVLTSSVFMTLDPGTEGVLFKRLSGEIDKDRPYGQGFHVVAPWNKMYKYDIRIGEGDEKMSVLSKNGLTIIVDLSYRFMPQTGKIGYLHEEVGPQYLNRIIIPEIRSATREVIGKYLPEELYSTKREAIQDEIYQLTKESCAEKYIVIDAILIKEVALPKNLKESIEQKLQEEQLAFQFEFKLDRERKEAERKIIEAEAKAAANRILNASLTDKILQDKGIEATLELSKSPNSKVVIVGGKDGLPLILGNN